MVDAAAASTSSPATPTSILICREDANDIFPDADDGADFSVADDECLLAVDQDDEYVAVLLSKESASNGEGVAPAEEMAEWVKAERSGCVRWIIKTIAMFRFGGKTAYLAVTYFDRLLALQKIQRGQEWFLQLLAVACLSLAAKVEEYHQPLLSEYQLDAYEFHSSDILRMELHVLTALRWQMITVTPFSFISCFAARFRLDERRAIVRRAVQCVFDSIEAMSTVEYPPSTIALASILVARNKATSTNLDELKAIVVPSWPQLDTGHVYSCYSAMIQEDKSSSSLHSTEVASSGVSVTAHVVSPDTSVNANNVAASASPAAPDNKRRRVRSPQRQ